MIIKFQILALKLLNIFDIMIKNCTFSIDLFQIR